MPQNQKQTANQQSAPQSSHGHGRTVAVVVAAAIVVVIALVTAFLVPGWALRKNADSTTASVEGQQSQTTQTADPTPTISASALPGDATELLKAMPDTVLDFARTAAAASTTWQTASPVEEYTLTYSTGNTANDVTVIAAQWSDKDSAKKQYDALVGTLTGKELASGNVKVSGSNTGAYVTREDASDANKAVSVWQNDTVVFQATGAKQAVQDLTRKFPL
ncbi:hypothetical protein G1C96_0819 [Bifidobacterium sp. DSM 109958]|uniref:Uncharacterized protein n=1 Tax=Bifidobacterium moraviense TaxID=2675323 RepID=A0A7Y0F1D8_9BIFI|nr:hypothetical protein [Bifidobacterium sp. DSM 109958]NMN00241.1 hypothetical protein [Bifidobacterium sp. DSM 109958]